MDSQAFSEHTQYAFIAYCKKVLRFAARSIYRRLSWQADREVSLSAFTDGGAGIASVVDEYFAEEERFEALGFSVAIKSELLAEALRLLPPRQRDIIMRYYFLDMNDREISETSGEVRSTVGYQRNAALKKLKKTLEDLGHEE